MDQAEILKGGNSNQVVKEQNTVIRNTGKWSPFVHRLLNFLEENGFQESPRLIEIFDDKERLSFVEGKVGHDPLQPFIRSNDILIEAATLLRKFHDLTQHFKIPPSAQYMLPVDPTELHEVICHNDFAPYNCVFRDHHLVGIIDFDTAAPGKRIWDVAYAVYRFVPLATDKHCRDMGWEIVPDRLTRLRLFCDAYGLEDCAALIETIIKRIEALVQFMQDTSSNLDHIPVYLADVDYIRQNFDMFQQAITP